MKKALLLFSLMHLAIGLICQPTSYSSNYNFFTVPPMAYIKNGRIVQPSNGVERIIAPNAPLARANSPLMAGGNSGYFYIGTDDNIHDIYKSNVPGGWSFGNLGSSIKCKPNSSIAADYAYWSVNGNQTLNFVFYVTLDNYVGCLEYDGLNWQNTVFNFGQTIREGSPMTVVRQDGCPVLLYIGDDNRIHGYNKWHGKWYHIHPDPGAVKCRANSPLVSGKYGLYNAEDADAPENFSEDAHGFYIGEDNKVYTVWTVKSWGGNWKTDCISHTILPAANSQFYFVRLHNIRQSKLVYQGINGKLAYFYATPEAGWLNSGPLTLPSNLTPESGTPLAIRGDEVFYRTNGNIIGIRYAKQNKSSKRSKQKLK